MTTRTSTLLIAILAGIGPNCTYDTSSLRGTGFDGGDDATANSTDGLTKLDGPVVDSAITAPDVSPRDTSSDAVPPDPIFFSKEFVGGHDCSFAVGWCAVRNGKMPKLTPAIRERFLPNYYWTQLNDGVPDASDCGYVSDTGTVTADPGAKFITLVVCVHL